MKYTTGVHVSDFPDEGKKKVSVKGKDILLVKYQDAFYAVDNRCPHMGGSLFDGTLDGHYITCPKHGSVFDIKNGKFHQGGKMLMLKVKTSDLKSYPVSIEGEDLFIEIE